MCDLEIKLKEMILDRYGSLSKFSEKANIPWTTLDSVLKRGVNKSNISNIIKICKELKISADKLAEGDIVSVGDDTIEKYPENIRSAARGMMNLSQKDQETAFEMINYLIQKGKEDQ